MEAHYLLEDVDGHVEVVVLHGGGGVDGGQWGSDVDHELVVKSSVANDNIFKLSRELNALCLVFTTTKSILKGLLIVQDSTRTFKTVRLFQLVQNCLNS